MNSEFEERDTWLEEQISGAVQEYNEAMEAWRKAIIKSIANLAEELTNETMNAKTLEELEEMDDFLNSLCDLEETENDAREND